MSSFQISKARLKQIIREEQEKLDAEGFGGHQEDIQELASFESVDVGEVHCDNHVRYSESNSCEALSQHCSEKEHVMSLNSWL